MAVLPAHPSVEVTVICNGAPLQEYDDEDADDQDGKGVSKYIEAVSGAEFSIQSRVTSPWPAHTILFRIWIDQKYTCGFFCEQENYRNSPYVRLNDGAETAVNGIAYVHKYTFSALEVDDSAPVQDKLLKDIKGMGQFTIKSFFVKNLRSTGVTDRALQSNSKTAGKIPEKALKGRSLSHQTSLRAPQATGKAIATTNYDYIDSAKAPFATYTFNYRSRDALQSLLIIPRTPSPVPLEDRDVDTLSSEEMRELLCRQRERDAAARAVKQERGVKRERSRDRSNTFTDDTDDEISVVATKRRREHYRTTVDESGVEAIDLT